MGTAMDQKIESYVKGENRADGIAIRAEHVSTPHGRGRRPLGRGGKPHLCITTSGVKWRKVGKCAGNNFEDVERQDRGKRKVKLWKKKIPGKFTSSTPQK